MTDPTEIAKEIGNLLKSKGMTLGAVESATGGLISHLITNVSGCSDYYKGSITSYSNEIKTDLVGVKADSLKRYGAVSAAVAEQMAEGGRRLLKVDICVADTGIAGPTGATPEKPVGLFYIGLAASSGTSSRKYLFSGTREENKLQAAIKALEIIRDHLRA